MAPKEKARELIQKFTLELSPDYYQQEAKQCALICINEVIDFTSKQGVREPIMYLNMVKREVSLL